MGYVWFIRGNNHVFLKIDQTKINRQFKQNNIINLTNQNISD